MEGLIGEKLSRLREYTRYLGELRDLPLETFLTDFRTRGAAERYLQLAIESILDIGSEIISSLHLPRPERYRDIPKILADAEIIPRKLSDEVAEMIGFRNLLVHDYATIDKKLEHRFLQERLPDFDAYMARIARWLKTKPFNVKK